MPYDTDESDWFALVTGQHAHLHELFAEVAMAAGERRRAAFVEQRLGEEHRALRKHLRP